MYCKRSQKKRKSQAQNNVNEIMVSYVKRKMLKWNIERKIYERETEQPANREDGSRQEQDRG